MDFELSSEQKMLRDTVVAFTKQKSPVERFRKLREEGQAYDPQIWSHMGELGWLSVPFSEDDGGFGGDFSDVMVLLEGIGSTLVPEPYIPSVVLGGMALSLAGSTEQKSQWLAPMIEGQSVLALAHGERASRFDARPQSVTATAEGDGWRLRGDKNFVLAGHIADQLVVSAASEAGPGLFVVDPKREGVQVAALKTMDAQGAAHVGLDVKVESAASLGRPSDEVAAILEHVLDYAAAAACAESVGVASAVLDMTLAHLKEREQFGVSIGTFQVLQHDAVDMFVQLQLMRSMAMLASVSVGGDDPAARRRSVSAAKAHVALSGRRLTQSAIQLHGGIGITDEHDVGLYFKRMHALSTLGGDEDHHVRRFAAEPGFTAGLGEQRE